MAAKIAFFIEGRTRGRANINAQCIGDDGRERRLAQAWCGPLSKDVIEGLVTGLLPLRRRP